jgi:hypothetical protein
MLVITFELSKNRPFSISDICAYDELFRKLGMSDLFVCITNANKIIMTIGVIKESMLFIKMEYVNVRNVSYHSVAFVNLDSCTVALFI